MKCRWENIREMEEYRVYFSDFAENQHPERDYLISVISSNNQEATQTVMDELRKISSVAHEGNSYELVTISVSFLKR